MQILFLFQNPSLRGGFSHEVFLLTSVTWINKICKGVTCALVSKALINHFLLNCTNFGLRGGVGAVIHP